MDLPPNVSQDAVERSFYAYTMLHELKRNHRSLEEITAIGLMVASAALMEAAGCAWVTDPATPEERRDAYQNREDVAKGRALVDHALSCDCTTVHTLAMFCGRMGTRIDQVYAQIRHAKANQL